MMKVREMNELKGRERSVCDDGARWYQTMHDARCTNAAKHCATLRANGFAQSSLVQSCRRRLIHLSKSWRPLAGTEPGRQAVHKDFANGVIKATHSLRSHKLGTIAAMTISWGGHQEPAR
jgi:hypothetical protein